MYELNDAAVDRLYAWDEKIANGDHSDDEWVIKTLKSGARIGNRLAVFDFPCSADAVAIALAAGVDFTVRTDSGETVLFGVSIFDYDLDAYKILAHHFADAGLIDAAEEEGLTALSVQVKMGREEEAEVLLSLGASPNTFGRIARYGYSRLDIPTQAINVMYREGDDRDQLSIRLLALLKKYGLIVTPEQKAGMIKESRDRSVLKDWIAENL